MVGLTDQWMDRRRDGHKDRWMDGRTHRWMDGWMDRRTDRQMDRWMDGQTNIPCILQDIAPLRPLPKKEIMRSRIQIWAYKVYKVV